MYNENKVWNDLWNDILKSLFNRSKVKWCCMVYFQVFWKAQSTSFPFRETSYQSVCERKQSLHKHRGLVITKWCIHLSWNLGLAGFARLCPGDQYEVRCGFSLRLFWLWYKYIIHCSRGMLQKASVSQLLFVASVLGFQSKITVYLKVWL